VAELVGSSLLPGYSLECESDFPVGFWGYSFWVTGSFWENNGFVRIWLAIGIMGNWATSYVHGLFATMGAGPRSEQIVTAKQTSMSPHSWESPI
jgi:hypothetical protein